MCDEPFAPDRPVVGLHYSRETTDNSQRRHGEGACEDNYCNPPHSYSPSLVRQAYDGRAQGGRTSGSKPGGRATVVFSLWHATTSNFNRTLSINQGGFPARPESEGKQAKGSQPGIFVLGRLVTTPPRRVLRLSSRRGGCRRERKAGPRKRRAVTDTLEGGSQKGRGHCRLCSGAPPGNLLVKGLSVWLAVTFSGLNGPCHTFGVFSLSGIGM